MPSFGFCRYQECTWCIDIHTYKTPMHIKQLNKFLNRKEKITGIYSFLVLSQNQVPRNSAAEEHYLLWKGEILYPFMAEGRSSELNTMESH